MLTQDILAPIECYIMQGEHPLPKRVVEKFAKTGGELAKNVFMLSALLSSTPNNRLGTNSISLQLNLELLPLPMAFESRVWEGSTTRKSIIQPKQHPCVLSCLHVLLTVLTPYTPRASSRPTSHITLWTDFLPTPSQNHRLQAAKATHRLPPFKHPHPRLSLLTFY